MRRAGDQRGGRLLAAALLGASLLVARVPAGAEPEPKPAERKAELNERIRAAREAVDRILRQESDVGTEVERAEAELSAAREASRRAREELASSRRSLEEARIGERRAREELHRLAVRVGPRLQARYRLLRRGGSGVLLLAEDPAAWLRLSRSFDRILAADIEALRALREAVEIHRQAAAEIEAAEADVQKRVAEAARAEAAAEEAAEARRQLLASIREERRLQEGVVRELEAARRRLERELAGLQRRRSAPTTGFEKLRGRLAWPVQGAVVEVAFGKVINARFRTVTHQNGLDLRIHEGAEVRAAATGQVAFAGWFRGYGNLVILDHGDGFHTLYAHLAAVAREVGERVEQGELIGLVGDTGSLKGPYLYFELRANGKPIDPMPWLQQ